MNRIDALRALETKVAAGEWLDRWQDVAAIFPGPGDKHLSAYNAFHGSLDAAKALHEAVLPGWENPNIFGRTQNGHWDVYLRPTGASSERDVFAYDDNPARAWLIAIIRALIAMENKP